MRLFSQSDMGPLSASALGHFDAPGYATAGRKGPNFHMRPKEKKKAKKASFRILRQKKLNLFSVATHTAPSP